MNAPTFKLSPMLNGRYQMLAYDAGQPEYAIEMFVPAGTDAGAIAKCQFEARWLIRDSVIVRDAKGRVIYDGAACPVATRKAA